MDFTADYQSWDKVDPITLFDAPTVKSEAAKGVVQHLKRNAHGCDRVVLWLDCDREGENICFEVLNVVKEVIHPLELGKQVFRARFSSITEPDIRKAFASLSVPNKNESDAVDARQELDLKVCMI